MNTHSDKIKTIAAVNGDNLEILDLEALYSTWEFFQKNHWVAPNLNHTPVIDAWDRCRRQSSPFNWHLPHVASGMTLCSLIKRTGNLISITRTVLEDTFSFLPNKSCALIFTDETGCTLLMIGDAIMCQKFTALGIKEGAFWSEGRVGSNAISQSLHLSGPVSMYGAQHFNKTLHHLSGHAAPVISLDGRLCGVLALFTEIDDHQVQDCALIASCAREVSSLLHLETRLSESNQLISQREALLTGIDDGVIAWDNTQRISYLNLYAEQRLNIDNSLVVGQTVDSFLLFPPFLQRAIKQNQPLSRVAVTFQCGDAFIEAIISFKPISEQNYLLFLHPLESTLVDTQYNVGTDASLDFDTFVANSLLMKTAIVIAKRACKSPSPLLLLGENGCGKQQLAKVIHDNGLRRKGPFISLNCASFDGEQMLLELFAYDAQDNAGKVEMANGGTLYLEHIECLSQPVQARLLQMLKTNSISHYKTKQTILLRLNLICSTSLTAEQLLLQGDFSRQFYYAISAVELSMPALRDRPEDLPELIEQHLARLNSRYRAESSFSLKAKEYLCSYQWPGNIAELHNCLEKCLLQRRGDKLGVQDLPSLVVDQLHQKTTNEKVTPSLAMIEKQAIEQALLLHKGKSTEVAAVLGIGRTTLWRKLKKYQLQANED